MPAVRTIQRLYGPDRKPCLEYGPTCQGCPGWDSRAVNLIYEVKGHQAQPDATRLQPTWAQPNPHHMSLPSLPKENSHACYVTSNLDLIQSQYDWFSIRRNGWFQFSVFGSHTLEKLKTISVFWPLNWKGWFLLVCEFVSPIMSSWISQQIYSLDVTVPDHLRKQCNFLLI